MCACIVSIVYVRERERERVANQLLKIKASWAQPTACLEFLILDSVLDIPRTTRQSDHLMEWCGHGHVSMNTFNITANTS